MILSVLGGNIALLLFPSGHVYGLLAFILIFCALFFYVMCPGIEVNLAFALQVLY